MTLEAVEPTQRFQEFFKKEKYRQKIAQSCKELEDRDSAAEAKSQ